MKRAVLVALVASCGGGDLVALPAPASFGALLVHERYPNGERLTAYEADADVRFEADDDEVEVLALFYREPLAELGLRPGVVTIDQDTRALPAPTLGAFSRATGSGGLGAVGVVDPGDPRLERLRLPALTSEACGLTARCLVMEPVGRTCSADCEGPSAPVHAAIAPPVAPAAPSPPSPPGIVCPAEWTRTSSLAPCLPAARPPRVACPRDQAQGLGASGCAPVGRACPSGDWPVALPIGERRFVRAGGGLDPMGAPAFATIAEALVGAPSGAILALSAGDHPASALASDATLIGACAARTRLVGPLVEVRGSVALRDLTLAGGSWRVEAGAALDAEGVVFADVTVLGFGAWRIVRARADRAQLFAFDPVNTSAAEDLVLDASACGASKQSRVTLDRVVAASGSSIGAISEGELIARSVEVVGEGLIRVETGARVELDDLRATGTSTRALVVIAEAHLVARRIVVEGRPIVIDASSGSLELSDASLDGDVVVEGSTVTIARAVLGGALELVGSSPVRAEDLIAGELDATSSSVALARAHVRRELYVRARADVRADDLTLDGRVNVEGGRARVSRARGRGLFLRDGAQAVASDLLLERSDRGLSVLFGSALTATRVATSEATAYGVIVGPASTATVADLVVDRLGPGAVAAVHAREGGRLRLSRAVLRELHADGLAVFRGGIAAEDVAITQIRAETPETSHVAVVAREGARIALSRGAVTDVSGHAFEAVGGEITLEDVSVDQRAAAQTANVEAQSGMFVGTEGGRIQATRARFEGLPGVGAWVIVPGEIVLEDVQLIDQRQAGVVATDGGDVLFDRLTISDVAGYGVLVDDASRFEGAALLVRGVGGLEGRGRGLSFGSQVEVGLRNFRVEDTDDVSLHLAPRSGVIDVGRSIRLEDGLLAGARAGIISYLLDDERGSVEYSRVRLRRHQRDFEP